MIFHLLQPPAAKDPKTYRKSNRSIPGSPPLVKLALLFEIPET